MKTTTNFAEWMANTVKSLHYSNNEEMERAFERIEENYLE